MHEFLTIGTIMLFSAMLPGPDFALVTKNTLAHSRRAGIFTALGIALAINFHVAYCLLGLAVVISQSIVVFTVLKYIGAVYLIYLGVQMLRETKAGRQNEFQHKSDIAIGKAFRQGFLCNVLNPKASMFFMAFFTLVISPDTSHRLMAAYAVEMVMITFAWFSLLAVFLSLPSVKRVFSRIQQVLLKVMGVLFFGFGLRLLFVSQD